MTISHDPFGWRDAASNDRCCSVSEKYMDKTGLVSLTAIIMQFIVVWCFRLSPTVMIGDRRTREKSLRQALSFGLLRIIVSVTLTKLVEKTNLPNWFSYSFRIWHDPYQDKLYRLACLEFPNNEFWSLLSKQPTRSVDLSIAYEFSVVLAELSSIYGLLQNDPMIHFWLVVKSASGVVHSHVYIGILMDHVRFLQTIYGL